MATRPNLLLIVSDQHSPHVMGCAGDAVVRTPYHGHGRPQLFNLQTDPQETVDRAEDPACKDTRDQLLGLALAGWDPERIQRTLQRRCADLGLLNRWADAVQPDDPDHWAALPNVTVFPEA